MDFSLIKKEEVPVLQRMFVRANSLRVKFFAPALTLYMLTELFTDFRKLLSPKYASCIIAFLGRDVNVYKIYVILDALIVAFSMLTFVYSFFCTEDLDAEVPTEGKEKIVRMGFIVLMQVYLVVLLTSSFFATVITVYAFGAVDFTFFYMIALVCSGVFFSNSLLFIPMCIGFFSAIHLFVARAPKPLQGIPHVPYGIFLIIALCFVCVFRVYYLLSTIRYENEIKRFREAAERQNSLKSMFLANMSHEIRTPMNAIVGMSELAQDFDLSPAQKNTIRQIRASGIALVSIVNDILDFSKLEAGKMEIVPVDYDLLTLLYDIATICIVKLSSKNVSVRIQVDKDLPRVLHGDDVRLKQVLVNLVGNAAKFTDTGSISLRVERADDGRIAFAVADTGVGIKKEDLDAIFAEFQQVDMSMNRTKGGTGLGLAISKNLVRLMGGTLGVESEYGRGSVFFFAIPQGRASDETVGEAYLPIMEESANDAKNPRVKDVDARLLGHPKFSGLFAPQDSSEQDLDEDGFIAPNASVLVVDDNPVNIMVAQGMLGKFGIVPDTAVSGFESLEMIAEKKYDIVFMDHQMPVMDGVETLQKIRSCEGEKEHSVVIALSANAINGAKEMFLESGFDDFVAKPVRKRDFALALKKWLPADYISEVDDKTPAAKVAAEGGAHDEWTCPPEVMGAFVKLIDPASKELEEYLALGDIKNFTIKVHALKSSAKIVGAQDVSLLAAELEALGNRSESEDVLPTISEKLPELLALYRSCKERFKDYAVEAAKDSGGKKEKPPLAEQDARVLAERIQKACEENSLSDLEDLVKKLESHALTQSQSKAVQEVKSAAEMIDFDLAQKAASGLLTKN